MYVIHAMQCMYGCLYGMYACMFVRVCMYAFMCVQCMHVCVHVYMYVCNACVHAFMHVVCNVMYVCMYGRADG